MATDEAASFAGIIPIPITPFSPSGEVDERSLVRVVEFAISSGATALLSTANASECQTLSDAEHARVTDVVLGEARGEVPVIMGISSASSLRSLELARGARARGASAVNAMPPSAMAMSDDQCVGFFQQLGAVAEVPVFIQNYSAPVGRPLAASQLRRIVESSSNVSYVKEETLPEPLQISRLLDEFDDAAALLGVFGGQSGLYVVEEFVRGAHGNMPATHISDVMVKIWRALESDDVGSAREIHTAALPLMTLERTWGGVSVYKEVMLRRGLITTTVRRCGGPDLDVVALKELEWCLDRVAPWMS